MPGQRAEIAAAPTLRRRLGNRQCGLVLGRSGVITGGDALRQRTDHRPVHLRVGPHGGSRLEGLQHPAGETRDHDKRAGVQLAQRVWRLLGACRETVRPQCTGVDIGQQYRLDSGARPNHKFGRVTVLGTARGRQRNDQRQRDPPAGSHSAVSAAAATAAATAGATRGSSGLGTMQSVAKSSTAMEKIASAAAIFISSLMLRAPASSAPRNTPGKASTLLIWFGKSLRPVATIEACLAAASGWTSGSGFDNANTMLFGAMVAISSSGTTPPETPRKTSAPSSASTMPPVRSSLLVRAASSALTPFISARSRCRMPCESSTVISEIPVA